MLLYHPYKDSNHCAFRILSILNKLDSEIQLDQLKLIDFFYLFPHFLKDIKPWPRELKAFRKHLNDFGEPYENTPNKKKMFFDIEVIQNQALLKLASRELISVDKLKKRSVELDKIKIPNELISQIQEDKFNNGNILTVLVDGLCNIPWSGENGLKMRSGLMEYKYDE